MSKYQKNRFDLDNFEIIYKVGRKKEEEKLDI